MEVRSQLPGKRNEAETTPEVGSSEVFEVLEYDLTKEESWPIVTALR